MHDIRQETTSQPDNEEKKDPLPSVSTSDKDKNKHADASDKNTDLDKEPKKTEEVITGVSNLASTYFSLMVLCAVVIISLKVYR